MKIAIEGCCHGELDAIYSQISQLESRHQYKIDLLLICGDFQAVRNYADLQCMAVPDKYKELKDFYKYYAGEKVAPILTIVIGGNHEASNYMWELYHGGWLAPNIYFLGHAGSVMVNGIRISGASGIFKEHDFSRGNPEKIPYNSSTIRSIYHIREYCVRKLSLLPSPRIFLSHDWPHQIEHYGNIRSLLARKKFLRADIDAGRLGSPPLMGLLMTLRPTWWFAAHLHTRFEAEVIHNKHSGSNTIAEATISKNPDEIIINDDDDEEPSTTAVDPLLELNNRNQTLRNPDEIMLEDEEENVATPPPPPQMTKFLALDKCLPKRQFLEIVDVIAPTVQNDTNNHNLESNLKNPNTEITLCYDPQWLAVTRAFHPLLFLTSTQPAFPDEARAREMVARELEWVRSNVPPKLGGGWHVKACQVFTLTAPVEGHGERKGRKEDQRQPPWYTNPQTEAFCRMLEIPNKINPPVGAPPT